MADGSVTISVDLEKEQLEKGLKEMQADINGIAEKTQSQRSKNRKIYY